MATHIKATFLRLTCTLLWPRADSCQWNVSKVLCTRFSLYLLALHHSTILLPLGCNKVTELVTQV